MASDLASNLASRDSIVAFMAWTASSRFRFMAWTASSKSRLTTSRSPISSPRARASPSAWGGGNPAFFRRSANFSVSITAGFIAVSASVSLAGEWCPFPSTDAVRYCPERLCELAESGPHWTRRHRRRRASDARHGYATFECRVHACPRIIKRGGAVWQDNLGGRCPVPLRVPRPLDTGQEIHRVQRLRLAVLRTLAQSRRETAVHRFRLVEEAVLVRERAGHGDVAG